MDTQNSLPAETKAPQGMERRKVLRLLSHLRKWCGDNQFPSFTDVNTAEMGKIWDYYFFLDFVDHEDDHVVRTVGGRLCNVAETTAFEIQKYESGKWKTNSVFDDRDLMLFEVQRIYESGHYKGARVVEGIFVESTQETMRRTIFRAAS